MYVSRGAAGKATFRELNVTLFKVNGATLADVATLASATDLKYGLLNSNLVPDLAASKLVSGSFIVGSFATAIDAGSNSLSVGSIHSAAIDTGGHDIDAGSGTVTASSIVASGQVSTSNLAASTGEFSSDLVVRGNLNVIGSLDYIESTALSIADKNVILAKTSSPTNTLADGAGLYVCGSEFPTSNDAVSFTWNTGSNGNYWLTKGGALAIRSSNGCNATISAGPTDALLLHTDDGVYPKGDLKFGSSLLPDSLGVDVGSSNDRWGNFYGSNARLSGTITSGSISIGSNSVSLTGSVASASARASAVYSTTIDAGSFVVGSNLSLNPGARTSLSADVLLGSNAAYDIGASSNAWKNLYAGSASLSGSLSASGATLSAPLALGSNDISTTGAISSLNSREAALYSGIVDSGTLKANSNLTLATGSTTSLSTNVLPGSDAAYDIGASSNAWKNLYAGSATFSGSLSANGAILSAPLALGSNDISTTGAISSSSNRAAALYSGTVNFGTLKANSNLTLSTGSTTSLSADVLPGSNAAYDLGPSSNAWKNLYAGSAALSGLLSANGATLGAPINMGANVVYTTGTFSSSSNRASVVYSATVDTGALMVNSNASIAGALSCYSINTQNSNILAGTGSISGGALSGTSASFSGQLKCRSIDTQGCNISAGSISGGAFVGSSISLGTGTISGGAGNFSGDVTVSGKLQIGGTIDYVNTSELLVADKHVTLASTSNPSDSTASGAGIYIQSSNYATSNSTISLTWNQGCNGNYWLPKGGNLALPGTAGSKMVTLGTSSNGALQLLSDDGVSATSTALIGVSLIASGTSLDLGSTSNSWGTLYSTNVGTTSRQLVGIYSASIDAGTGTFGSNVGVSESLVTANGLTSSNGLNVVSGAVSLPAASLSASALTSGTFSVGTFDSTNISTSGTLGAGASTLGSLTSGQHNPTATATYDLGASATAWRSAYLSSNLTAGGAITASNGLTVTGASTLGSVTSGQYNSTSHATYDLGTSGTAWRSAYLSSNLTVTSALSTSNLTATGTVSLPAASLSAPALTTGIFSVGTFGSTNISTLGTLNAGASTLGSLWTSGQLNPTTTATYDLGASGTAWRSVYLLSNLTAGGVITASNGLTVTGASALGSVTSGQHNPSTTATYDLGASGTAWRSAYLSSNLTTGGSITASNGLTVSSGALTLPGRYVCSLSTTFDTVANGVKDLASFTCTSTTSGQISFDISLILSQTSTSLTKRYIIATGYDITSGGWQRCIPISTFAASGTTDNYELQMQSIASPAAIKFRLVHITNTFASTPIVNITASYAQNDVPTVAHLTGNAQYSDASWSTYGFVSSTSLCQVGGQVGVGTLSPSYGLDVTGTLRATSSTVFGSNVSVAGPLVAAGGLTSSNGLVVSAGTVSLPTASLSASVLTTGTFLVATFGSTNVSTTGTLSSGMHTTTSSSATGSDTVVLANTNTTNVNTKYTGVRFQGTDTISNLKDVSYIRCKPVDQDYVGADLVFATRTADSLNERLIIRGSGNVGVGTSAPSARFHVSEGSAQFDSNVSITGTLSCSGRISVPVADPGYVYYTNYQSGSAPPSSNTNGDIYGLGQWSTGTMRAVIAGVATSGASFNVSKPSGTNFTGFTDMLRVVGSNGNVGINNTSPTNRLDVGGPLHATGAVAFNSSVSIGGGLTVTAGQINIIPGIVAVNDSTDGGYTRGLRWWSSTDTNTVTYTASSGANKSPANATACASLDGRTNVHVRNRAYASSAHGFL
jgi:hypothetical protein